ncbi:MAG: L,D-transpeptidase [Cyanobacteria bacterium P01_G01_bin.54]
MKHLGLRLGLLLIAGGSCLVLPAAAAESPTPEIALPIAPAAIPPLGEADTFLPPLEQQLILDLSDRRVYLYVNEEQVAAYPVAIGREGWETPTGEFEVFQRVANPVWQHPFTQEIVPPGPENPLGARWLGFWTDGTNAIGFHGTPNEELIGQAVSHGCVRMRNADIEQLFEQVELGTTVIVRA